MGGSKITRCIAVIGPSGVGKSELVDQMTMLEGKRPPAAPPVDLRCAEFSYLGENWVALDCPGSLEFAQTALDAVLCVDAVVIVASPDPDQAVLAAPWIRLAETGNVPRFVFVNRIDECRHDARGIMSAIQSYSAHPIILRQVPIRDGERVVGAVDLVSDRAWRYRDGEPSELIEVPDDLQDRKAEGLEELLETLSEHDDWLLEEIIEDRTPATGAVYGICARTLAENLTVPAFFGSAATGNGIRRLMKALRHEAPQPGDTSSRLNGAVASTFMSRTRKHVGKFVWLRSFADELSSGATVGGNSIGGVVEPFGERPAAKASIDAGGVAAAVKSDHLNAGCLYSETGQIDSPEWYKAFPALWNRTISAVNDRDDVKLSEALQQIAAEDRSLTVILDQESGQVILGTQGSQHLRRVQQTLSDVFGVETDTGPFVAHYRETITRNTDIHFRHKKQSGGAGQFADVKLTVGPAKRGDGFAFSEKIHGGSVPRNYIPAVRLGAEEAMARGPLGFPVIDVLVQLYDGQHHSVDSSDMAFRIAGRGGVSEGLSKAQPVLLEPIFEVRFRAPSVFTGALNPMISSMRGQILGFDREAGAEGWDVVRALMPGTSLEGLINNLRSATQGLGRYEADFAHFQELYGREADEIVERRAEENARR